MSFDLILVCDLARIAGDIKSRHDQGFDVWTGVNLVGPTKPDPGKRGSDHQHSHRLAFAVDLDTADRPGHSATPRIVTIADAVALIGEFSELIGRRPTVVIDSGGGLQVRWTFAVPVAAHDTETEAIAARFEAWWVQRGADNCFDIPRILRAGGTVNRKSDHGPDGRPVVLLECDSDRVFTLDDFDRALPRSATNTSSGSTNSTAGAWEAVDPDLLHPADKVALEALKRLGGHGEYITTRTDKRTGAVYRCINITRPGKTSGNSATIGYLGPGITKVWSTEGKNSTGWPKLPDGVYDADQLTAIANGADAADVRNDDTDTPGTGDSDDDAPNENNGTGPDHDEPMSAPIATGDKYFKPAIGLQHGDLRVAVLDIGPIRRGPGSTLWRYDHGVWLPDGADECRRRASALLGQRHRRSHVEGIIADLQAQHPFISEKQPTQWINTANGLLDWHTGQLHPHTPGVPTTYQLTVNWNPQASCPTVDAWLATVVEEDVVELIWEIIGTCVYADQPFHRAILLLGPGRNGKGTLLRLVEKLIGPEHISAVTLQALGENRFMAAELFGKVANIAGDLDARSIGRTDLFKMATGGDMLTAEHKFGQPFTFTNRATMLFSANEAPGTVDHSPGFYARWIVVPFTRLQLAPGTEDTTVEPKLHTELEGVLVRAVEGLRRCMTRGAYASPPSVVDASTAFREATDPVRRFITEELNITGSENDRLPRSEVYHRYKEWTADNGNKPLGTNRFWPQVHGTDPRLSETRLPTCRYLTGARWSTEFRW